MSLAQGFYFYAIAIALAYLEIQIEGKHGWAEKLPTWRWEPGWAKRFNGRPITGYHVSLNVLLLLLFHGPFLEISWTRAKGAEILAMFGLCVVFWDFLWFAGNPHFGLRRFRRGEIWWFKDWIFGIPQVYFGGLAFSLGIYLLLPGLAGWQGRAFLWGRMFLVYFAMTAVIVAGITALRRVRPPRVGNAT